MKLTKQQLITVIKEELDTMLAERDIPLYSGPEGEGGVVDVEDGGHSYLEPAGMSMMREPHEPDLPADDQPDISGQTRKPARRLSAEFEDMSTEQAQMQDPDIDMGGGKDVTTMRARNPHRDHSRRAWAKAGAGAADRVLDKPLPRSLDPELHWKAQKGYFGNVGRALMGENLKEAIQFELASILKELESK